MIQRYKMKENAKFNQHIFGFFRRKLNFWTEPEKVATL